MTPTELSNLKFALFDVMDEGDPTRHRTDRAPRGTRSGRTGAPWLIYDLDEKFASEQRLYFVDTVLKRMQHLNNGEMRKVGTCSDTSHKGFGQAGCLDCTEIQNRLERFLQQ